jgi:hypothetical protein
MSQFLCEVFSLAGEATRGRGIELSFDGRKWICIQLDVRKDDCSRQSTFPRPGIPSHLIRFVLESRT